MHQAIILTAFALLSGPDWEEGDLNTGDAGNLPDIGQAPHGQPPFSDLNSISGELQGLGPGGDTQDLYVIYIEEPALFSAECTPVPAGSFDTQLWAFDASGFGILGNDRTDDTSGFTASSNDGSGSAITAPGMYLLAVSGVPSIPTDAAGGPLFFFAAIGEVSGPDGVGGSSPVELWSTTTSSGCYAITLTGAQFVPCEGDANGDGLVNVEDLVLVILEWGACPVGGDCPADLDGDGDVGVPDLVEVILNWAVCTPSDV